MNEEEVGPAIIAQPTDEIVDTPGSTVIEPDTAPAAQYIELVNPSSTIDGEPDLNKNTINGLVLNLQYKY